MGLQTFDQRTVLNQQRLVLPADGTGTLVLCTSNSGDRLISTCLVANRDTIPHVVELSKVNGATTTLLGSLSIPAGQGYAGTPSLDLFAGCLPANQVGILLANVETLNIRMVVAVVATFDVSFTAFGGTF